MKKWLCRLSVECVVFDASKAAQALAELRKQWPAEKEKDWDCIVVEAADEAALLDLIDTNFIDLLKNGVDKYSPVSKAAAVVKPFANAAATQQWRIGTVYHGGSAGIWYKPTPSSKAEQWLIPLPGAAAASTVATLQFREMQPFE